MASLDALRRLAAAELFDKAAVLRVAQKREFEGVLARPLGLARRGVVTEADDGKARRLQLGEVVVEAAGLLRAAGGVGLRVEKDDDVRVGADGAGHDFFALFVQNGDIGKVGGGSWRAGRSFFDRLGCLDLRDWGRLFLL